MITDSIAAEHVMLKGLIAEALDFYSRPENVAELEAYIKNKGAMTNGSNNDNPAVDRKHA